MLLGVWTVGHGFFFLMVTRPVHKDMKRVNCDEKHGFKEFCKSFFNHLFFKYIKGIFSEFSTYLIKYILLNLLTNFIMLKLF